MQDLGVLPGGASSVASAVNADGSVVVGGSSSGSHSHAFRWTSATGMQDLGLLPSAMGAYASAVSADGDVVVGGAYFASSVHAFRWINSDGTQDLGVFPGTFSSAANGVSADGTVIVGYSMGTSFILPYRWTSAEGFQLLGGQFALEYPRAISADGSTIVGDGSDPLMHIRDHALRWTVAGGAQSLPELPGALSSSAVAVNADGSTIVGVCNANRAVRWSASEGVVDLNNYFPFIGIDLTGWTLTDAHAVSADGFTIAGTGLRANASEGWVATLVKCPADFNSDNVVNSQDYFDFLTAYFAQAPIADFNNDMVINSQDFFDFVSAFFIGC